MEHDFYTFYIFLLEGGDLWGLSATTLTEANLKLDMDKRTAATKRCLHYMLHTDELRELVNLSTRGEDE